MSIEASGLHSVINVNSSEKAPVAGLVLAPQLILHTVITNHSFVLQLVHVLLQQFFTLLNAGLPDNEGTTALIITLAILLGLSFALAGAEVAFFSLTYKDINTLKTKQQLGYKRIVYLLEHPKQLLATLVIANGFVNMAIIIVSNLVIDSLIDFSTIIPEWSWLPFAVKVFMVSVLLVLFGEVMPKVMAQQNNIRFARDVGFVVEAFHFLLAVPGRWLVANSDMIEKKLSGKTKAATLEDFDQVIDMTSEHTASEKEKNILKGIVKFSNITVKQIMKTRMDVSGIEYNLSFDEVVQRAEELHYSRLPIYKQRLDQVAGILHTKDMLPYLDQPADFDWHSLLRSPYFVHEHKLIEDLLKEFQQKRIHFAVVVDEFGGTSGIVTLEDIIEEIIGDIRDEFDEDDADYKKLDEHNFVCEGKVMLNDICRIMHVQGDHFDRVKGDSDSLAGLVLELAGEIPQTNRVLKAGGFEFTVLEVVKNRVRKVKVTRLQGDSWKN